MPMGSGKVADMNRWRIVALVLTLAIALSSVAGCSKEIIDEGTGQDLLAPIELAPEDVERLPEPPKPPDGKP
jgi:hypothetical protein